MTGPSDQCIGGALSGCVIDLVRAGQRRDCGQRTHTALKLRSVFSIHVQKNGLGNGPLLMQATVRLVTGPPLVIILVTAHDTPL